MMFFRSAQNQAGHTPSPRGALLAAEAPQPSRPDRVLAKLRPYFAQDRDQVLVSRVIN
jgi:hypothetical protein